MKGVQFKILRAVVHNGGSGLFVQTQNYQNFTEDVLESYGNKNYLKF